MFGACCAAQTAHKLVFKLDQQSRQRVLRAYSPNVYTVSASQSNLGLGGLSWLHLQYNSHSHCVVLCTVSHLTFVGFIFFVTVSEDF